MMKINKKGSDWKTIIMKLILAVVVIGIAIMLFWTKMGAQILK